MAESPTSSSGNIQAPEMPDLSLSAFAQLRERIMDGDADIAVRYHRERMKVQAVGRVPLQKVYLWTGSNAKSNLQYKPENDGPNNGGGAEPIPSPEELVSADDTKPYLEVGLVIGSDPAKYRNEVPSRNKRAENERKERGVSERDSSAMRVFIPQTDFIAEQAKLYVGCHRAGGRLQPRVIRVDYVFFYPEIWEGIGEDVKAKDRMTLLTTKCKYEAALNKFRYKDASCDPKMEPNPRDNGIFGFCAFEGPLSAESARQVVKYLQVRGH